MKVPSAVDTIIVGGGVMGCATAYQLAKDGARVILLEQHTIGNPMGSSHGASRLFRLAHEQQDYIELARSAQSMWHALEAESGERLMQPVDAIDIGTPDKLAEFRKALLEAGLWFESLDREEITMRFPHFNLPKDTIALYQTDYAFLAADRIVNALAVLARNHGAVLLEGQAVQQILPSNGGVQLVTSQQTYLAGSVVLCAGSWMGPLLRQLNIGLPFRILKEVVTYYRPNDPEAWMPGRFPIFRHHQPEPGARWGVGFPIFEHTGAKMLLDCTGTVVEPGDPNRSPDSAVLARIRAYIARLLPSLGENIIETSTCRYTMTPDEEFILDFHPQYPQVVIASPCSGHGFKFAPLIGRILADLAERGKTAYDISRFQVDRFAGLHV